MRQSAILLLPLLLLACKKDSEEPDLREAAVHVRIGHHEKFSLGCITVEANGGTEETVLAEFKESAQFNPEDPVLNVVVFRKADWTRDVRITVKVFEKGCTAAQLVEERTQTFSLADPGWKKWHLEDLDTVDADGDGFIARGGPTNRGTDCDDGAGDVHPEALELCNGRDDNCDGQVEQGALTRTWYLDQDQDGYGRNGPGVEACDPPSQLHIEVSGDCDDERAEAYPHAQELCNGKDDNCDDEEDEPFKEGPQALNTPCTEACGGMYACNAAQNGTECIGDPRTQYYADVDGDGEGMKGGTPVAELCEGETPPSNSVANVRDCDDNDSAANTLATEVCDGLDNDCDDEVDELMSCGQLRALTDEPALAGRQWRAVAVGPTGYPVWVAGMDGALAVKVDAESKFASHDSNTTSGCRPTNPPGLTPDWHAAWVNPGNGFATLAGEDGWLAEHNGGSCGGIQPINLSGNDDYFSGVVGVGNPPQIFAVSTLGHLYEWTANPLRHESAGRYWGLHALGQDTLYAVGSTGKSTPLTPAVNLYTRSNWSTPTTQNLLDLSGYNGGLRAVWAANPNLIYAVGDGGLVMKGSGQALDWGRVQAHEGDLVGYVSVTGAPGSNNAYIVGNDATGGRLHRLTPHGWAKAPVFTPGAPNVQLRDIAMTSAGDFWIVGDDGHVYHFPEP
ncbi:putative metal-binding motif-containing protein [Myxococcus sp. Y35]|uniref:putative metal-binding motif-containing protein n=1 Tax=Pseudomyxococcus flavus TaxID=3115648 RepID=UPI003CF1FE7F